MNQSGSDSFKSKVYLTTAGFRKLQREFTHLKNTERPAVVNTVSWAAENGDRSENADYHYGKRRLREIDKRLSFLAKRLSDAEVIDPGSIKSSKVQFGATVTIIDDSDAERVYQIVGVDEIAPDAGRISWLSPIGRALINAREDDWVTFESPQGQRDLQVVKVEYKPIEFD